MILDLVEVVGVVHGGGQSSRVTRDTFHLEGGQGDYGRVVCTHDDLEIGAGRPLGELVALAGGAHAEAEALSAGGGGVDPIGHLTRACDVVINALVAIEPLPLVFVLDDIGVDVVGVDGIVAFEDDLGALVDAVRSVHDHVERNERCRVDRDLFGIGLDIAQPRSVGQLGVVGVGLGAQLDVLIDELVAVVTIVAVVAVALLVAAAVDRAEPLVRIDVVVLRAGVSVVLVGGRDAGPAILLGSGRLDHLGAQGGVDGGSGLEESDHFGATGVVAPLEPVPKSVGVGDLDAVHVIVADLSKLEFALKFVLSCFVIIETGLVIRVNGFIFVVLEESKRTVEQLDLIKTESTFVGRLAVDSDTSHRYIIGNNDVRLLVGGAHFHDDRGVEGALARVGVVQRQIVAVGVYLQQTVVGAVRDAKAVDIQLQVGRHGQTVSRIDLDVAVESSFATKRHGTGEVGVAGDARPTGGDVDLIGIGIGRRRGERDGQQGHHQGEHQDDAHHGQQAECQFASKMTCHNIISFGDQDTSIINTRARPFKGKDG